MALRPIEVEAGRGTAESRIVELGTAPQHSISLLMIKIIIVVKPSTTICWRTFIVTVPVIKTPFPHIAVVSPQNFGVGSYCGIHDQPNGLEEDFSRIIIPRDGIFPIREIRSRTYSKKLIPNLRVVATRDIKVSQA